ncbi:MAG: von Willebrand factor type A domain-containing protein, partial [Planctomycetaceae bacterium]
MTNYHDDPRLTAYVLGELSPGETAEVEALLAESADARAAVEEIRGVSNQLSDRLAAEAAPALTLAQRTAIMKGTHVTPQRRPEPAGRPGKSSTAVVAACLIVLTAGALVVFNEKGRDEPVKVNVVVDKSDSMNGKRSELALRNVHDAFLPRDQQNGQGQGKSGMAKGGMGKGGQWRDVKGVSGTISNLEITLPLRIGPPGSPVPKTPASIPSYFRPKIMLGPASDSRILAGKRFFNQPPGRALPGEGRWPRGGAIVGLAADMFRGDVDAQFRQRRFDRKADGYFYGGRNSLLSSRLDRLARLSDKPVERDELEKPDDGQKPLGTKDVPNKKTPQHFKPADVAKYRKNVDLYFDTLAERLPKREMAVLRVKERVSGKLALLERHVGALEKAGRKLEIAKGQELVVKVLDAELGDVDLDGDGRRDFGAEAYDTIIENAFLTPLADPLSTFSIDVDTASYSNVRRFLDHGQLPPRNAVRIEELINYFNYDFPQPKTRDPFSVTLESGACPWNPQHRLVLIGLKGRELPHDKRPAANLVFLIDVSGSMKSAKKLPLVQLSLQLLVDQMRAKDRISIVTYANNANVVLEPTPGDKKDAILKAIHG